MHTIRQYITIAFAAAIATAAKAQKNEIKSSNIASLQVVAGNNWLSLPVTTLHNGEPINISFDDLTHEYRRYAYRLEHCEANWTTSDGIFDSDFCEGFADGNTIDDVRESVNTNTLYTHYRLTIPNERCRPKIGGNYRLTVYDENEGDTVLTAAFMVVDPQMDVSLSVTSNTDIDTNRSHQQADMTVRYGSIRITNPEQEVKTTVLQNGDWNDARTDVRPQFVTPDGMHWAHCRNLIFNGGNEYHKFEILDVTHPTLGIEDVWWDGERYNARIWTDLPRTSYTYDQDANGAFYIRNSDNIENDYASEYVNVEFRLKAQRQNGDVFVNGVWTNGLLSPEYAMTYNDVEQQYETRLMLKQGYYSYRYVTTGTDGKLQPLKSEGNFFQTENKYQALVYHRPAGGRTDLLVGYQEVKFE